MKSLEFECCDYSNPKHLTSLAGLLNHYMEDPMGGHPALNKLEQLRLVDGLANHPTSLVVFIKHEEQYIGVATCFYLFSTFAVKRYLYIHDIVVLKPFRGQGLGRALMEELIRIAREEDCCKVTLEVREDNSNARSLYQSLGFTDCEPRMFFWTKTL